MSRSSLVRAALGALVCGLIAWQPVGAYANPSADPTTAWPVASQPATTQDDAQTFDNQPIVSDAQTQVVAQGAGGSRPKHRPLWRKGWEYTLDFAIAYPFGNTGMPSGTNLPGTMDVIARYGTSWNNRIVAGYYGLSEYPTGFSTGTVPLYLQGAATPIGAAPLSTNNAVVNNAIFIAHFDQIFWTKLGDTDLPLIISPTYTKRWGTIAGGTDYLPVEINGLPYTEHYRTGSYYAIALTFPVPVLTQPKYHVITTYTIGPQWTTGVTGANAVNTAQLVQVLHTLWHPTPQIQIDLVPTLYPNYLPTDIWPQHYFAIQYAAAYSFARDDKPWQKFNPFIQAAIFMGGAMNAQAYGITGLYCQALPCTNPASLNPSLGGNHAATFLLKFGIGRPDIIPL